MAKDLTVFICGRGRKRAAKKWQGFVCDVNGHEIQKLTVESGTYNEAFEEMRAQAREIPKACMVHLGLGQRLVRNEEASKDG